MDRDRPALTARRGPTPPGWLRALLYAVPVAFLAVFFLYPVLTIVVTGLTGDGGLALGALAEVVTDRSLRGVAWFTLWQALASTGLTLLLGLPGAYVLARFDLPGRGMIRAAVTIPFVLPTVVVGSAFTALLGTRGPLPFDLTGTVWAILAAHVFFNYAVVVRTVGGLWAHLDPRLEDAARSLGATRWRAFREVTLPLLRPAIAAAGAIVFLFTFTSFGVVLILGGPGTATLEVEIYRATAQLLDLRTASVLAIVQVAGVLTALGVYARLRRRPVARQRLARAERTGRPVRTRGERLLVGANLAVMALLLGAPIAVLVERSFRVGDGYGLAAWRALGASERGGILFVPPLEAVRTSLVFAAVATVIAVLVGGAASVAITSRAGRFGRAVDHLLMLPLGVSAVTVGFGFIIALDEPPLDLRASWWLVPVAQALVATPFVIRILSPVIEAIDHRLREAAGVLGAGPGRIWREVDLPIVSRALLVASGFAFAVSLGEFGATVFVARATRPTLPIAIFRYLGQPGPLNFGRAMAMSVILMVLTATAITLIERVRVGAVGEF